MQRAFMPFAGLVILMLVLAVGGCSPASTTRGPGAHGVARPAASASAERPGPETVSPSSRLRSFDPLPVAEGEAGAVFRAMHPQLLACYAQRLATHPRAHAFVTVDVVVGDDGRPREVSTTGGALLGSVVLDCVTRHVRRAVFAPPSASGTSRVRVPFAFHPDADGDGG